MSRYIFAVLLLLLQLNAEQNLQIDYTQLEIYYKDSKPNASYVSLSSGVILVGSIGGALLLYLMPESVTNWNKRDILNLGANFRNNISNALVADRDDWTMNWVGHPYFGAVYYMQPRKAGYGWLESAFFSFVASTFFWEFGIEAFAEVPSWQDLIVTPAFGSLLGELFYQISMSIYSNNRTLFGSRSLGDFALIVMDPVGAFIEITKLDSKLGIKKNTFYTHFTPTRSRRGDNGIMLSFHYRF